MFFNHHPMIPAHCSMHFSMSISFGFTLGLSGRWCCGLHAPVRGGSVPGGSGVWKTHPFSTTDNDIHDWLVVSCLCKRNPFHIWDVILQGFRVEPPPVVQCRPLSLSGFLLPRARHSLCAGQAEELPFTLVVFG